MKRIKVALPLSVLLVALAVLVSPGIAAADIFSGKVISVVDGDTINIQHDNVREKVILYGIDCPESTQAFGKEATKFTDEACFQKVVNVEDHGKDSRGRTIGVVLLPDGTNLNRALVKQGLAWWSDKYAAKDATLKQLHETAKASHIGLWSEPNPVPPWIFRNGDKGVQATVMPKQQ
jgi:micrococcal nuclease